MQFSGLLPILQFDHNEDLDLLTILCHSLLIYTASVTSNLNISNY